MAERDMSGKAVEGVRDTGALLLVAALAVFAFIGAFLTAPLRK